MFVLNSVGLWGGQRLSVKAVSAYVSPALITTCVLCMKIWGLRARGRGRWIGRRVGVDLRQWVDFERRLIRSEDLIYPVERLGQGNAERGKEAANEYGGGSLWGGAATTTRRSSVETTQVGRYNRSNLRLVNNAEPPMQRRESLGQGSGTGSVEPLVDGRHEGIPMRDRRFLSPESTLGSRDGTAAGSEASVRQNY